jgi:hypothetical protein
MEYDFGIPNLLLGTISPEVEVPHFTHSTYPAAVSLIA